MTGSNAVFYATGGAATNRESGINESCRNILPWVHKPVIGPTTNQSPASRGKLPVVVGVTASAASLHQHAAPCATVRRPTPHD